MNLTLAIDASTLADLAVGARGLVRLRVEQRGTEPAAAVELAATLSGDALPTAAHGALAAGASCVLALPVVPAVAGIHELAGELRAGAQRYRFAGVHVRVGGDGRQVNIVNIDQSSARVVDNSRSDFGAASRGGLVGDGDWRRIDLVEPEPEPEPELEPDLPPSAPLPAVDLRLSTATATYHLTETIALGTAATIYGGRAEPGGNHVILKLVDTPSDAELLHHEARALATILAATHVTDRHFAAPRDQLRTADHRVGTIFDRLDGVDLTALRDRFRARGEAGVPPRHVVWILRRALAALGRAHRAGVLHGNLEPSHLLVRGRDHMVWLVDWCWAVIDPAHTGQTFRALTEPFSPPEVASRGRPTPASDLYALGKCAIHALGGDPTTKELPAGVDPRLARVVRYLCVESQGGRAQDAWDIYQQLDRVRAQIWGEHQFIPLDI